MPFITSKAAGGFGCTYVTSSGAAVSIPITYLMYAGGGGGGAIRGAGGGAGGSLYSTSSFVVGVTYDIVVGTGGTGGTVSPAAAGSRGGNTVFNSLTAIGGGGGGTGATGAANGLSGGSGGGGAGAAGLSGTGGTSTSGQGNIGGAGNGANTYPAGGGGGSAAAGERSTTGAAGAGGGGTLWKMSGLSAIYTGGGGGGGSSVGTRGAGGSGVGGNGATSNAGNGSVGTANTGSGGGGGGSTGAGGAGAAGAVSIISLYTATVTGTYSTTVLGNSASYLYTGNGSITYSTTSVSSVSAYSTRFKTTDRITVNKQVNTTLFNPGDTGAWTLEAWFYPLATTAGRVVLLGNGAAWGHALQISWGLNTTSKFLFEQQNGSNATVWYGDSTLTYALSSWYHLAVSKDSNNDIKCFINGVEDTAISQTNITSTIATNQSLLVNSRYSNVGTGNGCNCFTSNVRWTKGTALYTSNFTPNPLPLTSYPGPSAVLLCQSSIHCDTSENAYPVITSGTPVISRFAPSGI